MNERLIKFINRIYFGIYLYTRGLDIPITYVGRKNYYRGQLGFKLCCFMVLLYVDGCMALLCYLLRFISPFFINNSSTFKTVYFFLFITIYFIITQMTSLEGDKGLTYFEQFDQEYRSVKIKWMIIGAFIFFFGIVLFIIGNKLYYNNL